METVRVRGPSLNWCALSATTRSPAESGTGSSSPARIQQAPRSITWKRARPSSGVRKPHGPESSIRQKTRPSRWSDPITSASTSVPVSSARIPISILS
jgi:hypothetical protein